MLLSLCMIVKDEEEALPCCLESAQDIVDEIIIIDTGSHDRTAAIARDFGARIFGFQWKDDFSAARNFSLEKARGEWILVLDADEELEPGQGQLLRTLLTNHAVDIYLTRIINHINSTGDFIVQTVPRLFRNHPGFRYSGKIHEVILVNALQAKPDCKLVMSDIRIHHQPIKKLPYKRGQ